MLFERIKLEDDERIIKIVRKHWWIIATRTASIVISVLTPPILLFAATSAANDTVPLSEFVSAYLPEVIFCYSIWLLLNLMALANFWTDHYLDLWAITNRRIVAIEQHGFFNRFLSSFRLERLQDMNISVTGIVPTLLNFGRIEAQTAGGSNEEFATNNMPDPRGLKALIIRCADERQQTMGNYETLKTDGTL